MVRAGTGPYSEHTAIMIQNNFSNRTYRRDYQSELDLETNISDVFSTCTVLCCTIMHDTIPYCIVLYCIVLYYTTLYCTAPHCTVLYQTILYRTALYCTILYSIRDI
jgi:hypothetical protein